MSLSQPCSAQRAANMESSHLGLQICPQDFFRIPERESVSDFLLWQLADSAFPTGGFAHSAGLEAAWHHGELKNARELQSFLEASLLQVGHSSLPFMTATHREPRRLVEFDRVCDTFILNHVANRASRAQGRAFFAAARQIFGLPEFETAQVEQPPFFHLAPISGLVTRSLEIEFDFACSLFLFQHLRGLIAAALRLGVVGPLEGQGLQHRMEPRMKETLLRCRDFSISQITQVSPLLDLWQGRHDALYSRLFQS
jgi:urease accessory protein